MGGCCFFLCVLVCTLHRFNRLNTQWMKMVSSVIKCFIFVTWVRYNFYGGVMLIPLDMDDFDGRFCGKGEYPLLMAILDQFQVPLTPTTKPSFYMDTDLQPTTDSTTSTIISPDADSASYLYDMTEFSSSDNPSKSSSTVDYTTDSNIDVSTFSSSLYPTTTSTPINLTTSLFDTIRESKSILPEQAFAEGKPDVKFQIITDNKEKTGSTLMKRTEIDTPQISTQKNPARETNQSMTGNETKIDLLVPLHTFDTNRSKPIMNPMNEPRADFALIEPSLTILEAAIPISDMTKFTPALSSSEIAKATDTAIHSGATRTDYKLPDTMTNPETLQTDKTMPISSKYQNNFDKPEHQTTPVDIDKIQSQVRNTERFNEHVSWKSSEHSDPQLEVPVGNKQKYVSPVYSLNNRNDTKFSPIRASPTINVNKRRTSEPQQNARTSLDVPLWGIERGENIQKIDTSYLQSTNTLQNGNSVLDFIHKNGKSKQGRVLSSDTIFKPQITAFSKTFGERERTPRRKITQVMPRFIFPKLTKPQIQTEVIKNNDLRLDLKKATSPGKFSKESISSEETQPGRVRNIPLFEWFQKPLQPLSSGRNKVTNRFNRPLDNQEQNIDRKPTTFGVVRTTQNFPRNPEDKETNFAVANSVIKNKPYMNQLRPMIQTNLPVALSTFDSKQTMKTSSAISTDIDPFQNNDQSRRTDLTNSNDLKKQTSNNLKIKQINDPQRGTISRERPVKHSLQPFKVPSNREATPVLSFFDFKDLGLIVPSA